MLNTNIDENLLESEFYSKPFSFSYSSLNTLLTAPRAFYKEYILKLKDESFKKYLLEGTLIHYLVLENKGFDSKFAIATALPSENLMKMTTYLFKNHYDKIKSNDLVDYRAEILEYLKEINLYQSLVDTKDGTGDDKRMAKVCDTTSQEYFEFLITSTDKTIIDNDTLAVASERAEILKADPEIRKLLGLDYISDGKTYGIYNELPIEMKPADTGLPFGIKGIIDNLVIDVKNLTITINDIKTTSKSLSNFTESIEYWNYWLQASIYIELVKHFLKAILSKAQWTIKFNFIVFDSYNQLYAFPVSDETLIAWNTKTQTILKERALYHYESKDYTLPYEFAKKEIIL